MARTPLGFPEDFAPPEIKDYISVKCNNKNSIQKKERKR